MSEEKEKEVTETTETQDTKADSKFKSRKFIVFIIASVFQVAAYVVAFFLNNGDIAADFFGWWGGIAMAYIGCNTVQKFTYRGSNGQ